MNELIFLLYIATIVVAIICAARWGQQALIALVCIEAILMNLFVTKSITLFGLTATASDALAVGASLTLNVLQEWYGTLSAKRAVWLSFFAAIVYVLFSLLHCAYTPSEFDCNQVHFLALLLPMPRIIIASLIAYFVSQQVDRAVYALLITKFSHRFFILRNYISVLCAQAVDTFLFTLLGLWGLMSGLSQIILVSLTLKYMTLVIATPLLALITQVARVKRLEDHE